MFVEGPLKANSWENFFHLRASYLEKTYAIPFDEYQKKSVTEFEKIQHIPDHSEVYLWFDYDLYCFVNLLFIVQLISQNKTLKLFLVRPLRARGFRIWRGFDRHSKADLMQSYSQKISLKTSDLNTFFRLWNKLGRKPTIKNNQLVPFLNKHLRDYTLFEEAKKMEARWGFTEGQIKRILS